MRPSTTSNCGESPRCPAVITMDMGFCLCSTARCSLVVRLWRMLYATVARSEEILGINIEELDLAGRRAPVKAKGAQPRIRRRGAVREDFVLQTVYWDAGTARLLPRLLKGRTRGPVFVTHRRPGPGKVVSPARRVPGHRAGPAVVRAGPHAAGRAHRPRRQKRHEWRHSGLTHPGEAGASLLMLMARSRHKEPENVRKYFHPSAEAIAGGHEPACARRQPTPTRRPGGQYAAYGRSGWER